VIYEGVGCGYDVGVERDVALGIRAPDKVTL
jgi:hypothetical protein